MEADEFEIFLDYLTEELTEEFQYEPLSATIHQFRLLRVQAGPRDIIECSLEVVDGDDTAQIPFFRALSYTWGDPYPKHDILVNGRWLPIRENLFQFLQTFCRYEVSMEPIWIDQVCVNQSDSEEKNSQVQKMGEIYERAEEVIVCLGKGGPEFDYVLDLIEGWRDWADSRSDKITALEEKALFAFLREPWFSRIWVVQEVVLAREIWLFVGGRVLHWDEFVWFFRNKTQYYDEDVFVWDSHHTPLEQLSFSRRRMRRRGDAEIWELLTAFCSCKCTDPRDKIYGLLGLTDCIETHQHIVVDYNKPPLELYLDICYLILRRNEHHASRTMVRLGQEMGFQDFLSATQTSDAIMHFFCGSLSLDDPRRKLFESFRWHGERLRDTIIKGEWVEEERDLGREFEDKCLETFNLPYDFQHGATLTEVFQEIISTKAAKGAGDVCGTQCTYTT